MQGFDMLSGMRMHLKKKDRRESNKRKNGRTDNNASKSKENKHDVTDSSSSENKKNVADIPDQDQISEVEMLPPSPSCLQNVCSKLMSSLRTTKSLITKKTIIITLLTTIMLHYALYYYEESFFHHAFIDGDFKRVEASSSTQFDNPFSKTDLDNPYYKKQDERIRQGLLLYNKICYCVNSWRPNAWVSGHFRGGLDDCYCALEHLGLRGYGEKISKAADLMCSNNALCTYFLSKLPEAITWENLEKVPAYIEALFTITVSILHQTLNPTYAAV